MNIHLLGAGGAGMTALQEYLTAKGHTVTGSDDKPNYPSQDPLLEHADLCVYSAAIAPDHPLRKKAKALSIPTHSRGEFMGQLSRSFEKVIAVAGTHGKTTTSCLLTHLLAQAGQNPSALLGGRSLNAKKNGIATNDRLLVCEACEFAGSFLHLKRDMGILLNIDDDHLECYGSRQKLFAAFGEFANGCDRLLYNAHDETAGEIARHHKQAVSFGLLPECAIRGENLKEHRGFYEFDFYIENQCYGTVSLPIPGLHNVYNALAALGAAYLAGTHPLATAKGVPDFLGVARRFEILYRSPTLTVIDDYAHHPTEIQAVLKTARQMGYGPITVIFQPFTYSRTKTLLPEFISALSLADNVVLPPIMGGREADPGDISSKDIAMELPNSVLCQDFEQCITATAEAYRAGGLLITMGCGNITLCGKKIAQRLSRQER